MDVDRIGGATETFFDLLRQLIVGAAGGEDTDHVVGDFGTHRVPLVFHRHAMQLRSQIAQPVQCQDRQIGPGGAIETDPPPGFVHFGGDRLFIRAGADKTAAMNVEIARERPPRRMPSSICGMQTCSRYAREHSGCSRTPSATWPATRSIASPTAAMVTGTIGRPVGSGEKAGVIRESL